MPAIGLLGHYLELYDRVAPSARPGIEGFYREVAAGLGARGIRVVEAGVCRVRSEFEAAVAAFEEAGVDAIVSLHLAYSPSLESADALAATRLPLVVLDTTPSPSYGPATDPDELMYNHGIHGVQDLCNVLLRRGKRFQIEAGHGCDALDRVAAWATAAAVASRLRRARVGVVGAPFAGMGDFAVPAATLRETLGIEVVPLPFERIRARLPEPGAPGVVAEMESDRIVFEADGLDPGAHRAATMVGLAVRRLLEEDGLSDLTVNFDSFDASCGLPTVPFLEASKGMARGVGYAGEGDAMTAAFVGALSSAWPETTFTEMFCPDWEGDAVFVSHMGELNPALCVGRARLVAKPMPWISVGTPVIAVGRFRPGMATFADLAPAPNGEYRLLTARVEMLDVVGEDRHTEAIRGWFRPPVPVADFLAAYSRAGGTHHAALVYGDVTAGLARLSELQGWALTVIG
jgi:L-arabinose isomerase